MTSTYFTILNITEINSFIVYTDNNPIKQLNRHFLEKLAFDLFEPYLKVRVSTENLPKTIKLRIHEVCNVPVPEPTTSSAVSAIGRCKICSWKKNRKTKYPCQRCQNYLCLEHVIPMCESCRHTLEEAANN
ncbi:hypothetical protein NQ314_015209 [Rhamnusium bicolor]|uniref:Transposase n=1 Tax=Rhamnusium bicolor TaxID=1586634 RepID=A0AAV8WZH8_9CUCU|nr:hypothetical protein NQ314_015209 [Rhamnusium bicolor]